jgi:hypothetical protein
MGTQYTFEVHNKCSTQSPYTLPSNRVYATTGVNFLPAFCDGVNYDLTGSTCGNNDGIISVDEDYTIFYYITLSDYLGNTYSITDYYWTGLTAGYYQISATPKPEWWYYYGNDECTVSWIALEDSDTTLSLVGISVKPTSCVAFGGSKGRIVYLASDSNTGSTSWTIYIFNQAGKLVNTQNLTDISAIQYNSPPDNYYAIIENNYGCTLLIDLVHVPVEKLYSVEGIQRLFLTPWNSAIGYNYYSASDEDWYVPALDTQQFTSSKIKEFIDITDYWYEIRLNTAIVTYNQALQKGNNGLTYQETINVEIPSADKDKWLELVNVLSQRYIIVFQDNNENWWTCFYRNGAEVKSYRRENNTYLLSFVHPSITKMLTGLDYNYIKTNIL